MKRITINVYTPFKRHPDAQYRLYRLLQIGNQLSLKHPTKLIHFGENHPLGRTQARSIKDSPSSSTKINKRKVEKEATCRRPIVLQLKENHPREDCSSLKSKPETQDECGMSYSVILKDALESPVKKRTRWNSPS